MPSPALFSPLRPPRTPFDKLSSAPYIRCTGQNCRMWWPPLTYDWAGVWLCPADASLSPAWLEQQLVEAALSSGLSLTSIRVLAAERGREVVDA